MVANREYTDKELIYFLINIKNIGNRSILKIYENINPISKIFYMKEDEIATISKISLRQAYEIKYNLKNINIILAQMYELKKRNIELVYFFDKNYPIRLKNIDNKPVCLYTMGDINKLMYNNASVAIVGARCTSEYGKEMASYISKELAKLNIDIVSGMAYGIDAIAHKAALENGTNTYAILGCGINICYPRENIDIYEKIINSKNGAVISEFPLDTSPLRANFPLRNRIISGLADLVIIIEAKHKSGSLITANFALEQGREVYALPGRITDRLSEGCNKLISDGAGIITCIDDIVESLGLKRNKKLPILGKKYNMLANNEKMVYSCLDLSPKHLEYVIEKTGLDYSQVIGIILDLELKGFIKQVSGNYYIKIC